MTFLIPTFSSTSQPAASSSGEYIINFNGFNEDLIPSNSVVDVNIGTNFSPFGPLEDRHRILVDPLFEVCERNSKLTIGVTTFCFAVSNYTGFATFNEYNEHGGVSSSLSAVAAGTNHGSFQILSKRTVLVLEATVLFTAIRRKNTQIYRLKLDMQGNDLTTLQNVQSLLRDTDLVVHVMAECFCPKGNGVQIYQIDNACEKVSAVLQDAGYETKVESCGGIAMRDVFAYKKGVATDFLSEESFI